jgi:ABC-type branched-subunit amino acid transport system permease subunit
MGMIIFIIASGLTLVFGLMDVLNFGHGVFIALGAFVATSVLGAMGDWTGSAQLWRNLVAVLPAMVVAMLVAGAVGLAFERFIVRPVYGQHLKQILITMGGMIIGEELIKVIWGPQQIPLPLPEAMKGAWLLGDAAVEKYRVFAVLVGAAVFAVLAWTLARTKIGLLIRAGVQDREMVESLGYRMRRLFVACSSRARPGRPGRRDVGPVPAERGAADGRAGQCADLHRHHHRRPGQHGRRADRRAAGGADGQLHRLSGAQGGAVFQHRADGAILLWRPKASIRSPTAEGSAGRSAAAAQPHRLLSGDLPRSRVLAVMLLAISRPCRGAVCLSRRQGAQCGGQGADLRGAGGQLRPAAGLHRHRQLCPHHVLRHRRLWRGHCLTRWARAGGAGPGAGAALLVSLLLSLAIGLFSLRVRAIFFAMITLAVAAAFQTLASQLSDSPAARTA